MPLTHRSPGNRMKKYLLFLICLLAFGLANCSPLSNSDNEITQYIVAKEEDKKIRPIAKVIYKVSVERQEVVYWVEFPWKPHPQLYKIKNCIVANVKNWEGEADILLPWASRVKFINGKFRNTGREFLNVGWWSWHFETEPKPTFYSKFLGNGGYIFLVIGISSVVIFILSVMDEKLYWGRMKMSGKRVRKDNEKIASHKWKNLENQEI